MVPVARPSSMSKLPSVFFQTRIAKLVVLCSLASTMAVLSVAASTPSSFLSTTCSTLTPATKSVVSGTSGTILFLCGSAPGFSVVRPGSAIPNFYLPVGYKLLTIVAHVSGAKDCSLGRLLVSGQESSFSSTGDFDYCASYTNPLAQGLATFTLTWSKI